MEKEIKSIYQSHSDNQQKKKQTISLDTTLEPIEIVKSVLVSSARAYRTLGSRLETNFFAAIAIIADFLCALAALLPLQNLFKV